MKIGVIQTAFIGDVILTTPFLETLKSNFPNAEVWVVTTQAGQQILAGSPNVHSIALNKKNFKKGIQQVLEQLPHEPLDLLFCVHRSFRSKYLAKKMRAYSKISFAGFWAKVFGFSAVPYPEYSEHTHYADKPMALLASLGSVPKTPKPKLYCEASDETLPSGTVLKKQGYVVLSPFSVWGTKTWFADRYARVTAQTSVKHGLPIVIVGSGDARENTTAATITEKIQAAGGKAINLFNKTSLGQLKCIVRDAKLLLSNDSSPIHVAAAFDVPTVAIFGPTVKKWGFFPLSTKSIVVEKPQVQCRPCSLHGPNQCPKKHFRCMNEIQVEEVTQAVETLL